MREYRVGRKTDENGVAIYSVYEIFYEKGKIDCITELGPPFGWNLYEVTRDIELMLKATKKPVVDIDDYLDLLCA